MTAVGYGALPGGADLIRLEQNREIRRRFQEGSLDTISFSVLRDFSDDFVDVKVEVLDYHGVEQGGCWDEKLGPSIELGRAFYSDGKECALTELEREAAEERGIREIEAR